MLVHNLRLIHETHVPLHSCRVQINRNDPWYTAMKYDIIAAKKHWHLAERQCLKNTTIPNKHQFNKAKNSIVKIMHRAKFEFYLYDISSATSKQSSFAVCDKLLELENLAFFKYICIGPAACYF